MAILAGSFINEGNGFVLDRLQNGGPGALNFPEEKIYELGNWESIATIRDIPELTWDGESFDVTSEAEALLCGIDPTTLTAGQLLDFKNHQPIDIVSPFKSRRGQFDIVKGIITPYLTLERFSYRYGLGQNAAKTFSLRGDSIFYTPGQPMYQEGTFTGAAITLDETANLYTAGGAATIYATSVVLVNTVTGDTKRIHHDPSGGQGYQNTPTTVTINGYDNGTSEGQFDKYRITYGTSYDAALAYDPDNDGLGENPSGNIIHQGLSAKPAAVRPKDIDVYLHVNTSGTVVPVRLTGVQSAEINWSVTLEQDEEFGNPYYVSMDYDVPDVSGSIGVKPVDPADLWNKLAMITGVDPAQIIGPNSSVPLGLEVRIYHPDTGTAGSPLQTLYVKDADFPLPGLQGQVQTKLEQTLAFTSTSGDLQIYNGAMP